MLSFKVPVTLAADYRCDIFSNFLPKKRLSISYTSSVSTTSISLLVDVSKNCWMSGRPWSDLVCAIWSESTFCGIWSDLQSVLSDLSLHSVLSDQIYSLCYLIWVYILWYLIRSTVCAIWSESTLCGIWSDLQSVLSDLSLHCGIWSDLQSVLSDLSLHSVVSDQIYSLCYLIWVYTLLCPSVLKHLG